MDKYLLRIITFLCLCLSAQPPSPAEDVKVAAAANFSASLAKIQKMFEAKTSHTLLISYGSSGKLYAQIKNGAPFDVFLSADAARPRKLEEEDEAVAGTLFTYATGRLVLWSAIPGFVDAEGKVLRTGDFKKLSIADPETAPYGAAARETLQALGLWDTLSPRLVRGADIAQAFQFVATQNAELGFTALSQVKASGGDKGSIWLVPENLHKPLRQQAVLLKKGANNPAAREFLKFLRSEEARAVIRQSGYQDK